MLKKVLDKKFELLSILILVFVSLLLRVPYLGYSDYIGDEHKAFLELSQGQTVWNFFMEQRKGPMQFFISYIPYFFTGNWRNEFAERVPFTIFGILSLVVFYKFLRRFTQDSKNSHWIAFLATFFLSVNGFIIGFARIAQYQNLNLFFSFLALYFYYDFYKPSDKLLRNTLLGTVSLALSILSHWDAIFVLPPIFYFVIVFLLNKNIDKKEKVRVIVRNFALGAFILLPFLVPYVYHQMTNQANKEYFERRVQMGQINYERYEFLIRLYNPFFVLEFMLAAGALALIFIKKTWKPFVWFAINYSIFEIFVRKPGTHIYNFIIPFVILVSMGIVLLLEKLPKLLKVLMSVILMVFMVFFTYQSYKVFIDHKVEYPWEQESMLDFVCSKEDEKNALGQLTECGKFEEKYFTPEYRLEDKAPLFGFPLKRFWDETNDFVNMQNSINGEDFRYVTNEVKTISEWYMDAGYGTSDGNDGFYAVGIKRPLSFVTDWKLSQYSGKTVIYEIEKNGEVVVRVYRVEKEKNE